MQPVPEPDREDGHERGIDVDDQGRERGGDVLERGVVGARVRHEEGTQPKECDEAAPRQRAQPGPVRRHEDRPRPDQQPGEEESPVEECEPVEAGPVDALREEWAGAVAARGDGGERDTQGLSLIHISEPTRLGMISYAVFCLQKKKNNPKQHNPPQSTPNTPTTHTTNITT